MTSRLTALAWVVLGCSSCGDLAVGLLDPASKYDRSGMEPVAVGRYVTYEARPGTLRPPEIEDLLEADRLVFDRLAAVPGLDEELLAGLVVFLHEPEEVGSLVGGLAGLFAGDAVDVDFYGAGALPPLLTHELTHAATFFQHGPCHRVLLEEGVAVYVESSYDAAGDWDAAARRLHGFLEARSEQDGMPPLSELVTMVGWLDHREGLSYPASGAFCHELVEVVGWEGLWQLYASERASSGTAREWDELLEEVSGLRLSDFDERIAAGIAAAREPGR